MLPLLVAAPAVQAAGPTVEIRGGADPTGHHYTWTVINRGQTAIEELKIPVYAADLFFVPDGWEQEMINRAHLGWKEHEPSFCIARKGSTAGILPGLRADFGIRIAARGAMVGRGTVTARFADGSEVPVADVELPVRPARPATYVALVGVAVIFGGWVVLREWRRRGAAAGSSGPAGQSGAADGSAPSQEGSEPGPV